MDCMKAGGSLPTVLNAANEIAVEAFLAGRISFHQIASMVEAVCEAAVRRNDHGEPATVGDALEIDRMTRRRAREALM
jgi:1-deoxy-D-xylulose-5-phosphate reductoisomerase